MKIAVIDDRFDDAFIIIKQLQKYFKENHANLACQIFPFQKEDIFWEQFVPKAYDLIFIDYYLGTSTGLEIARQIRKADSSVILIFVTTTRDFAIDCYKVKASGYLVKPLVYDELFAIMSLIDYKRLKEQQFIEIINGHEKLKILLQDIIYCDMEGHYAQIHTNSAGIQKSRVSFSYLAEMLTPYPEFLLCYRGCIINLNHIDKATDLTFLMTNGERIPFRKKEKAEILKIYSDYLFDKARSRDL